MVEGMNVRDLMEKDVTTLKASDDLGLAEDIMELGRIRHLPVLSKEKLVGIVSQRDLLRAAVSSVLGMHRSTERGWLQKIPVRDVMSKKVVTIVPGASVREATELMRKKRIGCLPVVENERLVGLLSETDCLRYLARVLELPELKQQLPLLSDA
jgi:CBS-domain-containing membrane protein